MLLNTVHVSIYFYPPNGYWFCSVRPGYFRQVINFIGGVKMNNRGEQFLFYFTRKENRIGKNRKYELRSRDFRSVCRFVNILPINALFLILPFHKKPRIHENTQPYPSHYVTVLAG